MIAHILDFARHYVLTLSALERFALTLVMLVTIPRLCRRAHVPETVGLLLGGVIVGPYVLGFFSTDRPISSAQAGPCSPAIAQFEQAVRQSAGNPTAGPVASQ